MARIRTIKPEFFTSEDIVALSPLARLLYIACWCEADRQGRMEWKPGTMKFRYFPGDDCEIKELAKELIDRGLVVVYEIEGREYAEIPTFCDHQIINNRESTSTLPPRVKHASTTREARVLGEGRKEGKGGRVVPLNGTPPPLIDDEDEDTPVVILPLVDGTSHSVMPLQAMAWAKAYPAVDVHQALRSMAAWLDANPRNRKTRTGIDRFVVNWLSKEQNRAARIPGGGSADEPWAGAI